MKGRYRAAIRAPVKNPLEYLGMSGRPRYGKFLFWLEILSQKTYLLIQLRNGVSRCHFGEDFNTMIKVNFVKQINPKII